MFCKFGQIKCSNGSFLFEILSEAMNATFFFCNKVLRLLSAKNDFCSNLDVDGILFEEFFEKNVYSGLNSVQN